MPIRHRIAIKILDLLESIDDLITSEFDGSVLSVGSGDFLTQVISSSFSDSLVKLKNT